MILTPSLVTFCFKEMEFSLYTFGFEQGFGFILICMKLLSVCLRFDSVPSLSQFITDQRLFDY